MSQALSALGRALRAHQQIVRLAPAFFDAAVVDRVAEHLNDHGKPVKGSRILVLGLAYKADIDDVRESPSFELIELLEARGAKVEFYDPHVAVIPNSREHAALAGRKGVAWDLDAFKSYDAALICTDHDGVDYCRLVKAAKLRGRKASDVLASSTISATWLVQAPRTSPSS
ncbi:MAG: UDP binding domain-containing protein [Phycisphaerae bacterium]